MASWISPQETPTHASGQTWVVATVKPRGVLKKVHALERAHCCPQQQRSLSAESSWRLETETVKPARVAHTAATDIKITWIPRL